MLRPRISRVGVICAFGLLTAACATHAPAVLTPIVAASPVQTVPAAPAPQVSPQPDPVADLIALSTHHFESGQKELQDGHLESAKTDFNRALEVLLQSPYGARTDPRIRAHFDRLVERISAYELTALAQGDGFTEKKQEPASIDELLAISTFDQPQPTKETTETVAADLESTMHDIDIPLNAKVLSFVQLFTGRLKGYLEDGLSRGARFLPMIQDVFRAEGLPLDLAYVPLVESAFKPDAVSHARAKGLWQFMHGTALENGLRHDWYIDERADPEKATRAAAKYLKTLYSMFGDWHLALASYNGGPGRLQKAIKRAGTDDFWQLSASTRYLPRETRDYVPLILAAIVIARNPAQYGLNIQPFEPPKFETVELPSAVDLRRVAEWANTPVQVIEDLNPELRRWTTPVHSSDYELKVPEGTADMVRARLADAEPDDLAPLNRYTVHKGDTLLTISRKLHVNRTDLAEANYLSVKSRLKAGQALIIPRKPTLLLAADTDGDAGSAPAEAAHIVPAKVVVPEAERTESARLVHRVKRGETLSSIARLYDTSVPQLKRWNHIQGNAIHVGDRLTIVTTRHLVATN